MTRAPRMDYWLAKTFLDMAENTVTGYHRVGNWWVNTERPGRIFRLTHARVSRLIACGWLAEKRSFYGGFYGEQYITPTTLGRGLANRRYGRACIAASERLLARAKEGASE